MSYHFHLHVRTNDGWQCRGDHQTLTDAINWLDHKLAYLDDHPGEVPAIVASPTVCIYDKSGNRYNPCPLL